MEYLSQIPSSKETKGVDSFPFKPDRLTHVLRKNRCITSSQVITIAAQRIGAEFGFLDSLLRLTLTYDQPEPSAPQSLVMKLSSSEARYQRIGNFYNAYEREFNFYETVALNSPIDAMDMKLSLRRTPSYFFLKIWGRSPQETKSED